MTEAEVAQQTVSASTIQQREQARGASAWTGPQGAADAFALMGVVWNVNSYSVLTSLYTSGYELERIG